MTAAYPPTYLTVGDADPFEPQSRELQRALAAAHVPVTARYWHGAGLGHEYQFHFEHPEAAVVLDDVLVFLRERTAPR